MGTSDESAVQQPLMQPRLVRLLKDRQRLVDFGLRKEFLDELEQIIEQRRMPDRVAERAADGALNQAKEAGKRPVQSRVQTRIEQMNDSVLNGL